MAHDQGARCYCTTDHHPEPLEYEWHHVRPLYLGGEDTPTGVRDRNGAWVCPTTHANTHELLRLFLKDGPEFWTWGRLVDHYEPAVSRYAYHLALVGYWAWRAGKWSAE